MPLEMSVRSTFLKIIRDFEKFEKLPYAKKMPKYEPTDSYFHIERQLTKFMRRYNNLNWHNHCSYIEIPDTSLNVNAMNEDESKRIIVHEGLSDNCSTDVNESKRNIVKKITEQFRGRIRVYYYQTKKQRV